MRTYNFIFYCLHSLLPNQKYIRGFRYAAGYLLTFLTAIIACSLYGLYILRFPDKYSRITFGVIFFLTLILSGLFNYNLSRSQGLFKMMIDENEPTTIRHKIIGLGLVVFPIIAFGTIGYFIKQ